MGNYQDRLLIEYLPPVIKKVREFQAIMYSEQPEIFNLFNEIQIALDNQFIMTLTIYGVERWEKMLGIVPKGTYTLEERRFTILTRLMAKLPYTMRMLQHLLTELCGADGFEIDLDANNYAIQVQVMLSAVNNTDDVKLLLHRVIPANLVIGIEFILETPMGTGLNIVPILPGTDTTTQLPQYIQDQFYGQDIYPVAVSTGSYTETTLPGIE